MLLALSTRVSSSNSSSSRNNTHTDWNSAVASATAPALEYSVSDGVARKKPVTDYSVSNGVARKKPATEFTVQNGVARKTTMSKLSNLAHSISLKNVNTDFNLASAPTISLATQDSVSGGVAQGKLFKSDLFVKEHKC